MAKVLIIEDSPAQAAVIQELVASAGHSAFVSKDFSGGVPQVLMVHTPDIVILDLMLKQPNGKLAEECFQICGEIKSASKGKTAVIVISTQADESSADAGLAQGADAFLQKPFNVDDLISVIDQLLIAKGKK